MERVGIKTVGILSRILLSEEGEGVDVDQGEALVREEAVTAVCREGAPFQTTEAATVRIRIWVPSS
jgi:hypothetical protein